MKNTNQGVKHHKATWEKLLTAETGIKLKEAGRLLAEARKRRSMSKSDLALRIGIDRRTLANLEEGSPTVSLGVFFQALSALHLLRGIEEVLRPENDLDAIATAVRNARGRRSTPKRISDEKVNF